tara:strand:- start:171 stop:797 length:627 start_codon:yes stop_codon:yes gene_type:complete
MRKLLLILLVFFGLESKAQVGWCDSLSYTVGTGQAFSLTLNTPGISNMLDSVDVDWQACNATTCYPGQGITAYFQNILQTDTLKICYDAYLYGMNATVLCNLCDSLVYDGNSWVLLNMGNPTSIGESSSYAISELYPNPANEIVHFDYYLNKPSQLILIDVLGNEVKRVQLSVKGTQKIEISDLSKGIYFGNVMVNNKILNIKKLIVR